VLSGEATHTNFMVFGLTGQGLEYTINRTRDEHANHYTTDVVKQKKKKKKRNISMQEEFEDTKGVFRIRKS
jgi:hypothetical protein